MTGKLELRAVEETDRAFLERVYASTRTPELAMTDWTDAQKQAFCRMQFEAQDAHYHEHYPNAGYLVILVNGEAAGRLYVDRRPREIRIMDIALLPERCGQGIGTRLLTGLQAEADASNRLLSIHAERFNPALRLYSRLGFQLAEDKGAYLLLHWTPHPRSGPDRREITHE